MPFKDCAVLVRAALVRTALVLGGTCLDKRGLCAVIEDNLLRLHTVCSVSLWVDPCQNTSAHSQALMDPWQLEQWVAQTPDIPHVGSLYEITLPFESYAHTTPITTIYET